MKKSLPLVIGLILGASSLAFGDLKIPSSVFTLEELDEAKARAAEKNDPLIFVVTNPGSS